MGGPKKKSLRQIEKQQNLRVTEQRKTTKTSKVSFTDKTDHKFTSQHFTEDELNELAKIKALTPFTIATKYDVKLSVAKAILKMLEMKQVIQKVASGRGLKIYKFI